MKVKYKSEVDPLLFSTEEGSKLLEFCLKRKEIAGEGRVRQQLLRKELVFS